MNASLNIDFPWQCDLYECKGLKLWSMYRNDKEATSLPQRLIRKVVRCFQLSQTVLLTVRSGRQKKLYIRYAHHGETNVTLKPLQGVFGLIW